MAVADRRVRRRVPRGRAAHRRLLSGLEAHLPEHGVGSVSELADGDAPFRAGGCPFSARSVAEMIRARAVLRAHT